MSVPRVAPLRGRGLKPPGSIPGGGIPRLGRSLTGAWIETQRHKLFVVLATGRSLTGAWIETQVIKHV